MIPRPHLDQIHEHVRRVGEAHRRTTEEAAREAAVALAEEQAADSPSQPPDGSGGNMGADG